MITRKSVQQIEEPRKRRAVGEQLMYNPVSQIGADVVASAYSSLFKLWHDKAALYGLDIHAMEVLTPSAFSEMVSRTPNTSSQTKILTNIYDNLASAGWSDAAAAQFIGDLLEYFNPDLEIRVMSIGPGNFKIRMGNRE